VIPNGDGTLAQNRRLLMKKKLIAVAAAVALVIPSMAFAGGDTGETPPGDPIEELAKLGCALGLWWLCEKPKEAD
jgi:hypothetical protein